MTTIVSRPIATGWRAVRQIERFCYAVGAGLVVAGLFHLGVFAVRGGPWAGPVSWRKPATFGLSFGLTLISVAWVTSYLRISPRWRTALLGLFAADCVLEVAGITVQAWRRRPSHFDTETPLDTAIAMSLAAGGAVLVIVLVTFAVNAFRHPPLAGPSMQLALRAGFVAMLVGLASGAAMIARGVTLTNTGHQQLAYQLSGFLKPVHAVSLHGILVLPMIAWLLARQTMTEAQRTRIVVWCSAGYAVAIVVALMYSLVRL
jgi:hypothetical protein